MTCSSRSYTQPVSSLPLPIPGKCTADQRNGSEFRESLLPRSLLKDTPMARNRGIWRVLQPPVLGGTGIMEKERFLCSLSQSDRTGPTAASVSLL